MINYYKAFIAFCFALLLFSVATLLVFVGYLYPSLVAWFFLMLVFIIVFYTFYIHIKTDEEDDEK